MVKLLRIIFGIRQLFQPTSRLDNCYTIKVSKRQGWLFPQFSNKRCNYSHW